MFNEKGEYTIEAAIIIPFVMSIIIVFLSIMITFFYRGFTEIKLNNEMIKDDIALIKHIELKTEDINFLYFNENQSLFQNYYEIDFTDNLIYQDYVKNIKEWLHE